MPRKSRVPRLTGEQRELAASRDAARVAMAVARRFSRKNPRMRDEIESAAWEGVVCAAATFDPGRGVRFVTHVHNWAVGSIMGMFRFERPMGYRTTRDAVRLVPLDSVGATGYDAPDGSRPVGWELESSEELGAAMSLLSPAASGLLEMCVAWGVPHAEACRAVGLGLCRGSQLKAAAIRKVRAERGVGS